MQRKKVGSVGGKKTSLHLRQPLRRAVMFSQQLLKFTVRKYTEYIHFWVEGFTEYLPENREINHCPSHRARLQPIM